jgi:hypothetical protein
VPSCEGRPDLQAHHQAVQTLEQAGQVVVEDHSGRSSSLLTAEDEEGDGRGTFFFAFPVPFVDFLRSFFLIYDVKYSGGLEVVCPVTNPASLYTLRCVRYVTCRNTFDVRFGRYSSGTRSVCALHVR